MYDLAEITANKAVEVSVFKFNYYSVGEGNWSCKIEHKEDEVKLTVESGQQQTLELAVDKAVEKYLRIRNGVKEFDGATIEYKPESVPPKLKSYEQANVSNDEISF